VEDEHYSLRRQSRLAGIPRSTVQYDPVPVNPEDLLLMRLIDEQYLKRPEYGSPRMTDWLNDQGHAVNHKRVERLMRVMLIQAIRIRVHSLRNEKTESHRCKNEKGITPALAVLAPIMPLLGLLCACFVPFASIFAPLPLFT